MVKFFKTPFALEGDRALVPTEAQVSGKVSYTTGYTPDYSKDLRGGDPDAKPVERTSMNAVFHDITEALGFVQAHGASDWSAEGKPYAVNTIVRHSGKNWVSLIPSNNATPIEGSSWTEFSAELLKGKLDKASVKTTTGTSSTDVMSQKAVTDAVALKLDKASVKTVTGTSSTDVMSQKAVSDAVALKLDKASVKTVTGTSATDVMSQKAVTDAVALKLDKASVKTVTGTSATDVMSQKAVTDAVALKLDRSAVKQVVGESTTDVMSQRGVKTALDLKADKSQLGNSASLNVGTVAGTVAAGDDARINGAVQKTAVKQVVGQSTTDIMSQKAVTDALLAIQDVVEVAKVTWDMDNDVYGGTPRATLAHKSMRRCLVKSDGTVNYYLNEYDSTKKANGVDAADLSGASGQVMVEISPVYVRTSFKDRIVTWELTHAALPGFVLHPAFEGGVEKTYIGAYDATVFSAAADAVIDGLNSDNNSARIDLTNDKLYSASGNYCMVGVHRTDFRTLAENHGYQLYDYWQWQLVQYLFITEFGNWNSQAVLGNGNVSRSYLASSDVQADSPHTVNGLSNNFGNYSGAVAQGSGEPFVTYRGIENAWGQAYQWVDGVNILERQLWVSNDETQFNDNNEVGYIELGAPMPESNWIKNWQTLENSFVPAVTGAGAGASTFIGDYLYTAAGRRALLVGGNANSGVRAGLSYANGTYSALNRNRIISARLSKKLRS